MKICPRCSELFADDAEQCPKDQALLRKILDPLIGKTVGGRYRLISRLGTGGMSSVYLARHVLIDRLMAIKTLRRDLAQDPVQRDRFLREARAVNRINHENIVEITDFGEADHGLVYLVMEYVPGESLHQVLGRGPLPVVRALHIAQQIGGALGRAHQMGVIHRDLKPENVLVVRRKDDPDFVKILDFGIAKIMDAPSITGSQQIFGTPGYIAPEYIQSSNIDGRSDLYSLGVMLYEMITGCLPFDYQYPGDLLVKHVTEEPIPARRRLAGVPEVAEVFLIRALRKDPSERFRDGYHFLEELQLLRERLGLVAAWSTGARTGTKPYGRSAAFAEDVEAERVVREELRREAQWRDPLLDTTTDRGARPGLPTRAEDRVDLQAGPSNGVAGAKDASTSGERVQPTPSAGTGAGRRGHGSGGRRPVIPTPPSIEGVDVPITVEGELRDTDKHHRGNVTPVNPKHPHGLLGVRRWRARFDAIRAALDEIEEVSSAPPEIAQAMAFVSKSLDELEGCTRSVAGWEIEAEEIQASARDFRATLGRAIDDIAAQLSRVRGEFEQLVQRRNALRDDREVARVRLKADPGMEGDADALLWELATVEEQIRIQGGACDELEVQLTELTAQLEGRNEVVEASLAQLTQVLDREILRIEPIANAMRTPLELAERFVDQVWPNDEEFEGQPTPSRPA